MSVEELSKASAVEYTRHNIDGAGEMGEIEEIRKIFKFLTEKITIIENKI